MIEYATLDRRSPRTNGYSALVEHATANRVAVMEEVAQFRRAGLIAKVPDWKSELAKKRAYLERIKEENTRGLRKIEELERKQNRGSDITFRRAQLSAAESPYTASTAIHEAGHAIACYMQGAEILKVDLRYSDSGAFNGAGGCTYIGESSAFLSLAGIAAEHEARSRGEVKTVSSDDAWSGDRSRARSHLPTGSDLRLEIARAQDRLRPYWPALRAVADRLRRDLELTGHEVEAIITAHPRRAA